VAADEAGDPVCREGCKEKSHATYRECLKAARFGVAAGETAKGQY
jgi:hypothetical protein